MTESAITEILRLCARLNWDESRSAELRQLTSGFQAWDTLVEAAEAHGLAPLVSLRVTEAAVTVPVNARQQLLALGFIHRDMNHARIAVLKDILQAFDTARIPVVVLKGAALAHLLYPAVGLRPFGDLDLLVDPSDGARAQALLSTLGFSAPPAESNPTLGRRHHLPIATKLVDRLLIYVEIHTNALTYDTPGTLTMRDVSDRLQSFTVEDQSAHALGHVDMLYHLCRHTAERAPLLRLIWIADVISYAERYRSSIPWERLRHRHPFVLNALALFHLVTPLPAALLEHITPSSRDELRGIGQACKPVSEIFKSGPIGDVARDLFDPSDWWVRLYYGLDDRAPLWWYRFVWHPLHVGYWLARRAGAAAQQRARRAMRTKK